MTRTFKLAAIAAATLIAAPAFAAVGFDANIEQDNTYENLNRGMTQGGRVELNAGAKVEAGGGFVAGRATAILSKSGGASVDDMWVQLGTAQADVKLGRFEAADLSPAGKDTLVEDAGSASGYHANWLRGRFGNAATSGNGVFHGALTVNAAPGVGFELGLVDSKSADQAKGVRPVVSFAAGPLAVKLGMEAGSFAAGGTMNGAKFSGAGATVGGTFSGVGLNVNLASGKIKSTATTAEQKVTGFGVNATFGAAGVGYVLDKQTVGTAASTKDSTFYAAYSLPLFGTGATITPAVSTSKGTGKSNATGLRARINYAF